MNHACRFAAFVAAFVAGSACASFALAQTSAPVAATTSPMQGRPMDPGDGMRGGMMHDPRMMDDDDTMRERGMTGHHGMMGQGRGMMGGGMMGGGMMGGGMMDMMRGCGAMMNRGAMMPQLPPGNEKLQLQMQAEMMQKMGEILSRYAARLPDAPAAPR